MRIVYSWGATGEGKQVIEEDIKEWVNAGYSITSINHREELDIERAWSPEELNKLYIDKDEKLLKLYSKITDLAVTNDVFIVNHENVYHPEFIKSLNNIYTVIVSGDDPESSDSCSKPYVHAFSHSFAWGVSFDKETTIVDRFREWGAKRADWWPCGVNQKIYNPSLAEGDIYRQLRDIDLVFVGGFWPQKLECLVKVKSAFPKMKIYGRGWNWRGLLGSPLASKRINGNWHLKDFVTAARALLLGFWQIEELPTRDLISLYQRCKVGLNIHLSYGPSNQRTYQLPANGVMQVCDCPEGLGQVFEIGKEVVGYRSIEEAIEFIRYYLEHEDERKKIAADGFKRTMKDYRRLETFLKMISKVKQGMLADGLRCLKDGSLLILESSYNKHG